MLANCLLNVFSICVGEVTVLHFKDIVMLLGCVSLYWLSLVLSSELCVCSLCGPSVCLNVPSICYTCVFV